MNLNSTIISETKKFVKKTLNNAEGGHDWWHVNRVFKTAVKLAEKEKADMLVVQLAALLHDIADSKFYNGNETIGVKVAGDFLKSQKVQDEVINHVLQIIQNGSFKNSFSKKQISSLELKIIQDADRLDAIGAIGIARTFNYGGFKNREIYNPEIKPNLNLTKEEYKQSTAPTINHFYEKLLLLKNGMHTQTAQKIAKKRHAFMEQFLEQFYCEWDSCDD